MGESIADKNKRIRKDALRESLKAGEYLRQLDMISDKVNGNWESMDTAQTGALKLLADLQFRRLAKVLPDLKAVEMTGEIDTSITIIRKTYEANNAKDKTTVGD